ncbi:MAG: helicase HerA-like domain-containing protein [Verrucomicrobiales bacterium]
MNAKPTLLGLVGAVSGSVVSVRQSPAVASGISIIGGKSYRIGQVGSFVRIPQGYHDLYGIVSEAGANATPVAAAEKGTNGERWITISLVGEIAGTSFERGISQYPNVNDEVHLVTEDDLAMIYGSEGDGQVVVGRLASADGIPVRLDLDKLVTRHSAVVGSTGAGKSTTVASLLRSIALGAAGEGFPSARILLLDIHGEYSQALSSVAKVFRINATEEETPLHIPYWALESTDLLGFLMGRLDDKPLTAILDRISDFKLSQATDHPRLGLNLESMTSETPIPFSLKRLWFELLDPEIKTWEDSQKTQRAILAEGDATTLTPPRYKPHGMGTTPPFINQVGILGIRRPLDQLRSRLLDRKYDFLLHPGKWEPDLDGNAEKDLADLLEAWLGHDRPITILDLSGVPSLVVAHLIGAIFRVLYEALFWGRERSEGGVARPLLVVMEEAHRYLSKDSDGPARSMVQRIVKEGRKFGVGAMIVSQRPSEVDETILSQCGTFVALRLSNSADRSKVQAALPDSLAGIVDSLPVLRTGEAIITGEAARLPIRCRVSLPPEGSRPNSEDPGVTAAWKLPRRPESYERLAATWRAQNPRWCAVRPIRTRIPENEIKAMERELVSSSTIISVGYDDPSETLEVEFKSGVYQYYNLPRPIYDELMLSDSKGKFLNAYIKNSYPCSKV